MMTDTRAELKKLIPLYCNELDCLDMSPYRDHEFSKTYQKRKEKLIKDQKKVYYPLIKTTGRRIVVAIIAAALMGTMTVAAYEPARNVVRNFFVKMFKDHSVVTAVTKPIGDKSVDNHKDAIEYQYTIDVPEGYTLEENETVATDTYVSYSYYNEDSTRSIYFSQNTADSYSSYLDNEHTGLVKKTDRNGNELLIHNYNDISVNIIWDDGEYIFDLSGDMS